MRYRYLRAAHTVGRKVNIVAVKEVLHYADSINWFCAETTQYRICRTDTDATKFADDPLCVGDTWLLTN